MENINLIPQEELYVQSQSKAVKLSTIFVIIFLVIVTAVSGYFVYANSKHNKEIAKVNSDIVALQKEIQSNAEVEIKARNLDQKFTALNQVFNKQVKYSLLLKEIQIRKPDTVGIQTFDLSSGKLNISGLADNYVSISNYINNLVDKSYVGGIKGLEGLFTSVALNTVTMDESSNQIQFLIVVNFDESKLR